MHTNTHNHTHTYAHTGTHIYIQGHTNIHAYTYTGMCIQGYIHIHIGTHIQGHTYICTYAHIYAHTYLIRSVLDTSLKNRPLVSSFPTTNLRLRNSTTRGRPGKSYKHCLGVAVLDFCGDTQNNLLFRETVMTQVQRCRGFLQRN